MRGTPEDATAKLGVSPTSWTTTAKNSMIRPPWGLEGGLHTILDANTIACRPDSVVEKRSRK